MAEEFNDNKTIHVQSSETISGGGPGTAPDMDYVRPAEVPEQDLYHGHSFISKWVFCQDASYWSTIFSFSNIYWNNWSYSFLVNAFTIRLS